MVNPPRKNAGKTRGRPFAKGNPGRPKGAKNETTRLVETLLEGEAAAIGRTCIERAKAGDPVALRLAMERIAPVGRGRPVRRNGLIECRSPCARGRESPHPVLVPSSN